MTSPALASTAEETEARTDLDRLQGTWTSVSGRREAELLIAGRLFTVRFKDGGVYMGAFDLRPGDRPKTMQMRIDEGPARHKGKMARCLYDLDGDALDWCAVEPGTNDRPPDFPSQNDPKYLYLVFRRERP